MLLANEVIPWYFSRDVIENNSPSRLDGIDLEQETLLRKSYCTFLNDLGLKLEVDQITIATAMVLCHRFFLRQSHTKNDRWTIATACMFLAEKVKGGTPLDLEHVIVVSNEIRLNKAIAADQRQKVYEQQKESILTGEKLVLSTLDFDLSVDLPYDPLTVAMEKYIVEKATRAQFTQIAWSYVNDSYQTTLCLQYQPCHIAAGAFFLAAKYRKMDLESYGESWFQYFHITPSQLDDICVQMREFYHNKKPIPASKGSIGETSDSGREVKDVELPEKKESLDGNQNVDPSKVIPQYFSRDEIENISPSRLDGIDLKKETRLRMSYCTFLKNLGLKLKVDRIIFATATVLCHRFFHRQSHAKNDRWTIATVCMFIAAKAESTRMDLKHVIVVSNEIKQKKVIAADQRQKVFDQQKESILIGEKLVLSTLDFDLHVDLPYSPLMKAIRKYIVEEATRAQFTQIAGSFVNDSCWTTLCLQYKPRQIAAGAFFLAAKYLKRDLESCGESLCQEFDITPSQLEDIRVQMLEVYVEKPIPASKGRKVEGSNSRSSRS